MNLDETKMDLKYFPHFLRKLFPEIDITNDSAIEICNEFKIYLLQNFKDKEERLYEI